MSSGNPAARGPTAELGEAIAHTDWVDTHEHLVEEDCRVGGGAYTFVNPLTATAATIPGGWTSFLAGYVQADMASAGLPADAEALFQREDASPLEQWDAIAPYLEAVRCGGHMRAAELSVERLFERPLVRETVAEIDAATRALAQPGYYRTLLRDVARIAHCHVHSLDVDPIRDTALPELLRFDISLHPLLTGRPGAAEAAAGIDVAELDDYVGVLEWCFEQHGPRAVAAKLHWAYERPLAVAPVPDPPRASFRRLRAGTASTQERREVEDYLFAHCVELAAAHGLPVKIHLGYLAGSDNPAFPHVYRHVEQIAPVVQRHRATTFVLMHAAWPQQEQLIALAKHQPNVVVDLCWSWILAYRQTVEFVQRFLTTAPTSKLLCFGGDYMHVECVVGHAELARRGLAAAIGGLVEEGWLSREAALALVPRLMHGNAERIFGA